jgi:Gas vesicle synthesis protein GvpL/GvpF
VTVIYVYGFIDGPAVCLRGCKGFANEPVERLTGSSASAVYSVHRHLDLVADSASLRRHDQVLTTLMRTCTVAPARFGSVLADVDRLGDVLAAQGPRLAPVLARLRGASELAVRASVSGMEDEHSAAWHSVPSQAMPAGRSYLLARRQERMGGRAVGLPSCLAQLHDRLASRAHCWTVRATPDKSLVGAYLIARREVDAFRDDLVGARADEPRLRATLTGPWAPYSFVEPETLGDG